MCPQNAGHSVSRMTQHQKASLVKVKVLAHFVPGWCPSARLVPGTWQVFSKPLLNEQTNPWHLQTALYPSGCPAASLTSSQAGTWSGPHSMCPGFSTGPGTEQRAMSE